MRAQNSISLVLVAAALLTLAASKSAAQVATDSPSTSSDGSESGQGGELKQRVVLYDEDPTDQRGRKYVGSVVWHVAPVKTAAGQQDIAVQGEIEVPDRRLTMRMTLQRNFDRTLRASHTIELTFNLPPDFAGGGIGSVPGILMKSNPQGAGTALAGLAVKVVDSFFLVGLSNADKDTAKNLELLRDRAWFDIPMVYSNQRRAILAIEKSNEAFQTALAAWAPGPSGAPITTDKP